MFIAAQAPLPNTFHDFFRMAWENACEVILMLTNWEDETAIPVSGTLRSKKSHPYLPKVGISKTFEDIQISVLSESKVSNIFVVRQLQLTRNSETRQIKHCHFLNWPEASLPDPTQSLELLQKISELCTQGEDAPPLLVHCKYFLKILLN